MKNIFKFLKKLRLQILFVFVLLFLQAICNLSLPQYTSDIVNVGIQGGGISTTVPEVLSSETYNNILLISTDEEKTKIEHSFKEIKETSENTKKYPLLKKTNVYQLISNNNNNLIANKLMIVSSVSSKEYNSKLYEIYNIPKNTDIFTILKNLSEEEVLTIVSNINKQLNKMPESIIEQASTVFVKNEYKKIGIDTDKIQNNYILSTGIKMLMIALLSMFITILVSYLSAKISAILAKDLRSAVFSKVMSFSTTEFNKFSTASLITRNTNDIVQIQNLSVMLLRIVFFAPIMAIGAIILVLRTNSNMTWIIAVAVLAILTLMILLFALAMPKFKIIQKLVDKLNLVSREILNGLSVIRAFAKGKQEEKRFDKANKDLMKTNLFVSRLMSLMMPVMIFIMNFVMIGIIWIGAGHIDAGNMQVGDMMAFMQYTMEIVMSFLMISMISLMLPRAMISVNRISEVLNTDSSIKNSNNLKEFTSNEGKVEFKDVSFRYPDADTDVINDINFTSKRGTTTAFIGSTGSGKSTIVNLIPRFFDVTGGAILIDNINIKDISLNNLHSRIGYVPQKGVLFSGTMESNIKYGNNKLNNEEMEKIIKISQSSFINELKEKEKTKVSQGGSNVSGGQKQRLSIARALATNADILIFDDSFSALDFKTDSKIRKELSKIKDKTILIVAQRISTIMSADQIIVLNDGRIVGKGTHKELLKSCEVYKQIATSQLSEEELDHA